MFPGAQSFLKFVVIDAPAIDCRVRPSIIAGIADLVQRDLDGPDGLRSSERLAVLGNIIAKNDFDVHIAPFGVRREMWESALER
ncbi:MAG: hypothetical protein KGL39_36355 [Patescibacteria group bacterium]|nr:hypothetical protein [Patescibacteria group bacterium]